MGIGSPRAGENCMALPALSLSLINDGLSLRATIRLIKQIIRNYEGCYPKLGEVLKHGGTEGTEDTFRTDSVPSVSLY